MRLSSQSWRDHSRLSQNLKLLCVEEGFAINNEIACVGRGSSCPSVLTSANQINQKKPLNVAGNKC